MTNCWQPGDAVIVRGVVHGRVWIAHPMTMVAQQVEIARPQVLDRITKRIGPFDSKWVNWKPEPEWQLPPLHSDWNRVWQS